jgi:hypothetical protein
VVGAPGGRVGAHGAVVLEPAPDPFAHARHVVRRNRAGQSEEAVLVERTALLVGEHARILLSS